MPKILVLPIIAPSDECESCPFRTLCSQLVREQLPVLCETALTENDELLQMERNRVLEQMGYYVIQKFAGPPDWITVRLLYILGLIYHSPRDITMKDIERSTGNNKLMVWRDVRRLEECGMLERTERTARGATLRLLPPGVAAVVFTGIELNCRGGNEDESNGNQD